MIEMIGHDDAVRLLDISFKRNRLSHAYLINGPKGCGKTLFSKVLASIVNCEARQVGEEYSLQQKAFCGECSACYKIERDIHPDLTIIFPEKSTIKIDQIRDMQKSIYRKPVEGRYKVYVIEQAEKMTEEAQNSLLKILEEPLGDTLILLTTSNKSQLLPTIASRCNIVNINGVKEDEVAKWLCEKEGLKKDKAQIIARVSKGLPGRALDILKSEKYFKLRKYIFDKVTNLVETKSVLQSIKDSEALINRLKKDGEESDEIVGQLSCPDEAMEFIADVFGDVIKYSTTGDENLINNLDQMENIKKIMTMVNEKECTMIIQKALRCADKIRARANSRTAYDEFLLYVVS